MRVVLVHVIGPETPDLDYLERFSTNNLFVSRQTLIILNAGLVLSSRSIESAFGQTLAHPTIEAAIKCGAEVVRMPRLACMSEVTDRGLTFEEAIAGKTGEGHRALNMFDKARVRRWWGEELPKMFSTIPSNWLPASREGPGIGEGESDAAGSCFGPTCCNAAKKSRSGGLAVGGPVGVLLRLKDNAVVQLGERQRDADLWKGKNGVGNQDFVCPCLA